MPARLLTLAAAVFLLSSGCGPAKLDESRTYDLDPGEIKFLQLPAQPKPQRLTVEFEATSPIEVVIYKAEDAKDLENLPASKALASEKSKTTGTVVSDLNPDVATSIVVIGLGTKTTVKLHVTNRK